MGYPECSFQSDNLEVLETLVNIKLGKLKEWLDVNKLKRGYSP